VVTSSNALDALVTTTTRAAVKSFTSAGGAQAIKEARVAKLVRDIVSSGLMAGVEGAESKFSRIPSSLAPK
jgi:hypothetical protein